MSRTPLSDPAAAPPGGPSLMTSLRQAFRLARRELRGSIAGFRVFLACLALGIAAIAAVTSVRESLTEGLRRESAVMLGGQAELRFTYRRADADEQDWMTRRGQVSEVLEFRSLAVAGDSRALTQVKAVDGAYPLLGEVTLDPPMPLHAALAGQEGLPGLVADPLLLARLGVAPGGQVSLGTRDFVVMAALLREPDAGNAFLLGPRSLVASSALEGSGLLAPGTMFDSRYRLLLPPGTDFDRMREDAQIIAAGSGMRWRDARQGQPGTERVIDRLAAFLILTGLAGLAVGGVGISLAVQSFLASRRATIATLKVLGASNRVIFLTYALQIALLAAIGLLAGLALGALLPKLVLPLLEARLNLPAGRSFQPGALAEAALYGTLAAALFTLWPLAGTQQVRAAALWRDAALGQGRRPGAGWLALMFVLALALVGTVAWATGAVQMTLAVSAGLGLTFLALLAAAALLRRLARRLSRLGLLRRRPVLRLALGAVGGPGGELRPVVLALGLGLTVLAAIGQTNANLRNALASELPERAPAFFVVDIQPDQIGPLTGRVLATPGVENIETAPMLRGVITRINGRPATELAPDHWVLRGDRGVTYSATPPPGTRVTEGAWWPADYQGPPQVSFGASEAAALGLVLGDKISVNILGREIEATITSFRAVDFSTGGIGFVMSMTPSALAGAPHSHIATIYAGAEAEAGLLRDLSQAWPNITLIPVREVIGRAAGLVDGVTRAVTLAALSVLVTGLIVLIGAAAASERARVYEAAVLKVLGASRRQILTSFVLRSALMGAAAALVALAGGTLAAWAVCAFVLETRFGFALWPATLILGGGILVTLLSGIAFALRPLSRPAARVLRSAD